MRLGIGDDCAILAPPPGHELLVTTDFSLEGRHFRRDWHRARSIGHRTLARGLSDLAAMGAKPLAAFLSLALPPSAARNKKWMRDFLDGFLGLAKQFGVPLAGGDTSESPTDAVLADVVLLGSAPAGTALRRSGAKPGDLIYCTGSLGGSAQELLQLEHGPQLYRDAKPGEDLYPHLFPQPRIAQGKALRERALATACIDLSDGLSTDLAHLCTASGVAAVLDLSTLPAAPQLRGADAEYSLRSMLHGGEDYELLFTARPETRIPVRLLGVKITRIGRITRARKGQPQVLIGDDNIGFSELQPGGWEHAL